MRAAFLAVAALCAPVVLGVPHGQSQDQPTRCAQGPTFAGAANHRHGHPQRPSRRALETDYSTVTDVVTVTANNAVVWVDQFNNVLSTEYHGQPTPTTLPPDSDVPTETTPTNAAASVLASLTADPSDETPTTSATNSAPSKVFSIYSPSTDHGSSSFESPVPLTTNDPDSTTPAPTSSGASQTSAADDRFVQNKGMHGGNNNNAGAVDNIAAAGNNNNAGATTNNAAAGSGFGLAYELIGSNGCKPQGQLNSEFGFLSTQGYSKLRFYDIGCDLSVATAAAAAAGFTVTLGLNTIGNVNGDLQTLIAMIKGNWAPIDTVVIGNEVVNSQGGSPGQVVAAVNAARNQLQGAGFTKNVVAVDTFMAHIAHPEICGASDFCAVNAHAFFDANTVASNAGSFVQSVLSKIQNNGKAIIVTESGWPYAGGPNGAAVPSPENQGAAIASLKSAFGGNPGGIFLFQAYDATYKAAGPFGVEQSFGIYGH